MFPVALVARLLSSPFRRASGGIKMSQGIAQGLFGTICDVAGAIGPFLKPMKIDVAHTGNRWRGPKISEVGLIFIPAGILRPPAAVAAPEKRKTPSRSDQWALFLGARHSVRANPFSLFPPFSEAIARASGHVPSVAREAFEADGIGFRLFLPVEALFFCKKKAFSANRTREMMHCAMRSFSL